MEAVEDPRIMFWLYQNHAAIHTVAGFRIPSRTKSRDSPPPFFVPLAIPPLNPHYRPREKPQRFTP